MRTFILFSRKGVTAPNFSLNDLPGSGGRMDLVCRCINSALWLSHKLRTDTRIFVVLNGPPSPPVTVVFEGSNLKRVSPDERNIASWIRKSLRGLKKEWRNVQDGIKVAKKSFQEIMREVEGNFYILHEKGRFLREVEIKRNPVFILGDHIGLPQKEERFALRFGAEKISLGKLSYLASQCITIVHHELDVRQLTNFHHF